MIKQVYDNRVDDILDYLRTRIIKEPFKEDIFIHNEAVREGKDFNKIKEKYYECL